MASPSLIVSVVRKGWGSTVLDASVKAGARGGTVLNGRGAGIHEQEKIFGMSIEPEKEIVLTLVYADQVQTVLDEMHCVMKELAAIEELINQGAEART